MENNEKIQHLQKVAAMLLQKVEQRLMQTDPDQLPPQSAKQVSATLKDIRDIQILQTKEENQRIVVEMAKELEEMSS